MDANVNEYNVDYINSLAVVSKFNKSHQAELLELVYPMIEKKVRGILLNKQMMYLYDDAIQEFYFMFLHCIDNFDIHGTKYEPDFAKYLRVTIKYSVYNTIQCYLSRTNKFLKSVMKYRISSLDEPLTDDGYTILDTVKDEDDSSKSDVLAVRNVTMLSILSIAKRILHKETDIDYYNIFIEIFVNSKSVVDLSKELNISYNTMLVYKSKIQHILRNDKDIQKLYNATFNQQHNCLSFKPLKSEDFLSLLGK